MAKDFAEQNGVNSDELMPRLQSNPMSVWPGEGMWGKSYFVLRFRQVLFCFTTPFPFPSPQVTALTSKIEQIHTV